MSTTKRCDPGKERFWRSAVQQLRKSGLSIRQFCQEHQLSEARFSGRELAGAGADGGTARRRFCKNSARCSVGVLGNRFNTSCRYAQGSTPRRWQVDMKLYKTAAVRPPFAEPTNK